MKRDGMEETYIVSGCGVVFADVVIRPQSETRTLMSLFSSVWSLIHG